MVPAKNCQLDGADLHASQPSRHAMSGKVRLADAGQRPKRNRASDVRNFCPLPGVSAIAPPTPQRTRWRVRIVRPVASPCSIAVIPCLQNRVRLSDTVAHLGVRPPRGPVGSGGVGCCCGQNGGQPDWLLGASQISRWLVRVTGADAPSVEGVTPLPRRAAHGLVGHDHTVPAVAVDVADPLDDPAPPPPATDTHLRLIGFKNAATVLVGRRCCR